MVKASSLARIYEGLHMSGDYYSQFMSYIAFYANITLHDHFRDFIVSFNSPVYLRLRNTVAVTPLYLKVNCRPFNTV